jgi:hypothetical protein
MSMGVDWPNEVYALEQGFFGRTIIITPVVSQPGQAAYSARGIFNTGETLVPAMDGSLISVNQTIVDILAQEFPILPAQRDLIDIPDTTVKGGIFEVASVSGDNGGGEITLALKRRDMTALVAQWLDAPDYSVGSPSFAAPVLSVTP